MHNRRYLPLAFALSGLCLALMLLQLLSPALFTVHGLLPALIFQALLLVSIFVLGLSYDLAAWIAALAGLVVCLSGYILYFHGAGGDGVGAPLSALLLGWAALRRLMQAPIPATASLLAAFFILLTLLTGRALDYAALIVVLVSCGLEDVSKGGRRAGWMAAAVTLAVACYLPLMGPLREAWDGWIVSTGKLTPGIGQVLNLSNPVWLPHVAPAVGDSLPAAPLFFGAWFALPLLFYIDWPRFEWKKHIPLYCVAGTFLLMATGAERIGPLFWPIDWLPYLHVALFISLFLALEQGPLIVTPQRLWCSLGGLLVTAYVAVMDNPAATLPALGVLALPTVLLYGLSVFLRHRDRALLPMFLGGTSILMAVLLLRVFPDLYRAGNLPLRQQSLFVPRHAWALGDFLAPAASFLIWFYFAAANMCRGKP